MIELLITLLLVAVAIYVINLIFGMIPLPPQAKTIAYIIIGLIVLFWLLSFFGIYSGPAGRI
jgi:uncharacterized membrane protein YuzA (DUF378 family)